MAATNRQMFLQHTLYCQQVHSLKYLSISFTASFSTTHFLSSQRAKYDLGFINKEKINF